jgi:HD-GYP domain-containing protein (c-di-GMP phosphodiesterase class II)
MIRIMAAVRPPKVGARATRLPLQAQAFICLVVAGAVAGFVLAARDKPVLNSSFVQWFLFLTVLTAIAWRYPVEFGLKVKVRVTQVSAFTAILLLPLPLAAGAVALGVAAGEVLLRSRFGQSAFNTSLHALGALAAGAILKLYAPYEFVSRPDLSTGAAVFIAAAATYSTNVVLVLIMASLHQRRNAFAGCWQQIRPVLPQEVTLYLLGIFAALIGHEHPWALLFAIAPTFIVYRSLRDGVALRTQTRAAVEQLADIVDMRDGYTFEHSRRVAELSKDLARRLGYGSEQAQQIFMAARVHDVGKIGIRSTTLFKETAMEDEELEEMRSHPEVGARLISRFPDFAAGRDAVLHHHERWDGKGYPYGLSGTAIPLASRIIAVADTFDAMTSNRAYREALPVDQVFAEMERGRGTQFEPRILDVFMEILREQPEYVSRTESVATRPRAVSGMQRARA